MHPFLSRDESDEGAVEVARSSTRAPHRHQDRYETVPRDLARGFISGSAPYRILVSATDAFCGRGVRSHASSLIGRLAYEFGKATGHGVDVELASSSSSSAADALNDIRMAVHDSTDVVIVELEPERLTGRESVVIAYELRALSDSLAPGAQLVLVMQAPVPSDGAAKLDRIATRFTSSVHLHLLDAPSGPAQAVYARWARRLAHEVSPKLVFPRHYIAELDTLDDTVRRRAVERLSVVEGSWGELLEPLVQRAKSHYQTTGAAIALLDDKNARFAPSLGPVPSLLPRTAAVCDTTLRLHGGLVFGDGHGDARFAGVSAIANGACCYYAGYRIRDPRGVPVGTICVFDDAPRQVGPDELVVIRDLAASAERTLAEALA